ncbi:MAG: ribonuclease Z [Thermoleophilia bacterium]
MDLRLVFLGTAGAVPTVERGPSGLLIIRGGDRLLVDCGEGTQRQLMRSVGLARIDRIFLTHLHGDHYLGLPGLLKTLSLQGREAQLHIYGPTGLEDMYVSAQRMFGRFTFEVALHESVGGTVFEGAGFSMQCVRTDHGPPSLAWALREEWRPGRFHPEQAVALGVIPGPDFRRLQLGESVVLPSGDVVEPEQVMDEPRSGRLVVVSGDTRPSPAVAALARGASVLVHDSTFTESERARALETRHSTAREAAQLAAEAGVGVLVLTHVSSRHSRRDLLNEARAGFAHTVLPDDLDHLTVPFPEKGRAELLRAPADGGGLFVDWPNAPEPV